MNPTTIIIKHLEQTLEQLYNKVDTFLYQCSSCMDYEAIQTTYAEYINNDDLHHDYTCSFCRRKIQQENELAEANDHQMYDDPSDAEWYN